MTAYLLTPEVHAELLNLTYGYCHDDPMCKAWEMLKAMKPLRPLGYLCDWGDDSYGLTRQTFYYGEPGSATEDDWSEFPKVHKNLPLYALGDTA